MSHHCHYPPCQHETSPDLAFCPLHWCALESDRKAAILYAGPPSSRPWLAAMRDAMADLFALDDNPIAEGHSRGLAARFRALEAEASGDRPPRS